MKMLSILASFLGLGLVVALARWSFVNDYHLDLPPLGIALWAGMILTAAVLTVVAFAHWGLQRRVDNGHAQAMKAAAERLLSCVPPAVLPTELEGTVLNNAQAREAHLRILIAIWRTGYGWEPKMIHLISDELTHEIAGLASINTHWKTAGLWDRAIQVRLQAIPPKRT